MIIVDRVKKMQGEKMKKISIILVASLLIFGLGGCSLLPSITNAINAMEPMPTAVPTTQAAPVQPVMKSALTTLDGAALSVVQNTFQQIYAQVNPSVVNIQITENYGPSYVSGEGSGFVWDTEGHIVTNNHVVEKASQITVVFSDGTTAEATLVGNDPESDLAVIQVDPKSTPLYPAAVGDSHSVKVGDMAIAIGNPYGLSGTMTQGIVSALSRSLTVDESNPFSTGTYTIPDIIQTDAAINPGNSGGVLVNVSGEVIGVTSAIQSSTNSNAGIGFAIPSHIVKKVVPVLIKDGSYKHPRLGISGTTLTPAVAENVGLDTSLEGILIVSVAQNSPAEKAGLIGSAQQRMTNGEVKISGGDVITAINGQKLTTYEELVSYMFNNLAVGQRITLNIVREGKERSIELTL